MIAYRNWVVVAILLLLAGCAGVIAPQTPKEKMALLDSQVTILANTVADLRQGGVITDAQFPAIVGMLKSADVAVTAGWVALGKGDVTTMQGQIELVNRLLWEIRARLPATDGGMQ